MCRPTWRKVLHGSQRRVGIAGRAADTCERRGAINKRDDETIEDDGSTHSSNSRRTHLLVQQAQQRKDG